MTGISRIAREQCGRVALTLVCGIMLGFSAEGISQQHASLPVEYAEVHASKLDIEAELPDAPIPQTVSMAANALPLPLPAVRVSGAFQSIQSVGQSTQTSASGANSANGTQGLTQDTVQGVIQGLITDRDGVPYQGVRVSMTRSTAPSSGAGSAANPVSIPEVRTETTDSNGRYQFRSVASGPFQLSVSSDGFATQIRTGTLNSGESLEEPRIALLVAATSSEVQVTASQHDIAQAQMKEEEQQRVFGVIPNFYVVYAPKAQPLSSRQKFSMAWRYSIDPVSFLSAAVFAGIEQEDDDFKGYGQGAAGYGKRFGAVYGDSFIGGMLGNAILPSLLKQDPRYFYKGTGTKKSRALYAIESSFICRGDNGKRQFNYSGILGGLGAAGISNLYYPAEDRNGAGLTFENTLIGIAGGAAQNLFQEFVVRHLTPKVPDYGTAKP